MRVHLYITLTLCTLLGCNSPNVRIEDYENLQRENVKLKQQNKILNDSLSGYNKKFVMSQILIGIPDEPIIKVAKNNNIKIIFHPFSMQMPQYEIFKVDGLKETKIGSSNKTGFDYVFIPKSVEDNKINLKVKIPLENDTIEIPAEMILQVEE